MPRLVILPSCWMRSASPTPTSWVSPTEGYSPSGWPWPRHTASASWSSPPAACCRSCPARSMAGQNATAAPRQPDAWSDPTLSGPELTRAAAIAQAPADLWRQDAMAGYLARLQRVRFSAEWLRPWRAGTLPPAHHDHAARRLAALGTPMLLLHGRQDMTFPAALAQQAAALIPAAR